MLTALRAARLKGACFIFWHIQDAGACSAGSALVAFGCVSRGADLYGGSGCREADLVARAVRLQFAEAFQCIDAQAV